LCRSRRLGLGRRWQFDYRRFSDRLDRDATTTTTAFRGGGLDLRFGRGSGGGSAAPTRRGRRRCNTRALLALPTGANACNLIVTQQTEMAAHGNIHLTKESEHLVAGNPEFARQIMYSKLAQPISSLRPSGIGARPSA
jgi:hypothetical protein